jgi:hypothetical protein
MIEGGHQNCLMSIYEILNACDAKEIFSQEFLEQNLSIGEMWAMQKYHDELALNSGYSVINKKVRELEKETNLSFPELYFA